MTKRENFISVRESRMYGIEEAIIGLILVAVFLLIIGICGNFETHYNRIGTVQSVKNEVVTIKDTAGNIWKFEGSNCEEGDIVRMRMYTSCTDNNIYDDEVTKITIIK